MACDVSRTGINYLNSAILFMVRIKITTMKLYFISTGGPLAEALYITGVLRTHELFLVQLIKYGYVTITY